MGPNKLKHATRGESSSQNAAVSGLIPGELQQCVLNVFSQAFPLAKQDDLNYVIQAVKGHLYKRDFSNAFSDQEFLAAYAMRWSASRALAYADIFASNEIEHLWLEPDRPVKVLCLGGGGGAEVVALSAILRKHSLPCMCIEAVDMADWSQCLDRLQGAMSTASPLHLNANTAAEAAKVSLSITEQLELKFTKQDILAMGAEQISSLTGGTILVTIMFTLNELFASSVARTTAFLLMLTDALEPGSWLLVVDSPGSYSEVQLGKGKTPKRYPMKWLLDHALLEIAGKSADGSGKWRKSVSADSRWFRQSHKLEYAIELENMRYQIHLYQRRAARMDEDSES